VQVSELGEFGLIERLAAVVGAEAPADLILGVGDDAAAWRAGEQVLLATTDTLVEGVHFLPEFAPWADVGWKALAANISDIAAMGGEPLFALVTLALPPETDVTAAEEIYAGLAECAEQYSLTIVGGDIVRAPQLSVYIALIGRAQMEGKKLMLMRRDRAQLGDVIAVTGTLGDAAAGLWRLRKGAAHDEPLVQAQLHPVPPLEAAQEAARAGIECAIDVSDGLLQDLGHICRRSGLGAVVEADSLPLSDDLRSAYPEDALALACTGGEDYALLVTGAEEVIQQLRENAAVSITVIGRMVDAEAHTPKLLAASGTEIALPASGWDHLRQA
jgi:thiamine-monophosphate kinase